MHGGGRECDRLQSESKKKGGKKREGAKAHQKGNAGGYNKEQGEVFYA